MDEIEKVNHLVSLLPEKYQLHASIWDQTTKNGVVEELIAFLKNIALRDRDNEAKANNVALIASKQNHKSSKQDESNKNETRCTYCKKLGHTWQKCYKRINKAKAKAAKSKTKGLEIMCISNHIHSVLPYDSTKWIVDSAATSHAAPLAAGIEISNHLHSSLCVGDGNRLETIGRGTFCFDKGSLSNVLVAPGLKFNLFSSSAAAQRGYITLVKSNVALIMKDNFVIFKAPKTAEGLYIITLPSSKEKALVGASENVWHRRLCHAGDNTLKISIKKKKNTIISTKTFCVHNYSNLNTIKTTIFKSSITY